MRLILRTALLASVSPLAAQTTSWFNFESRTNLALAPEPGGSVLAFGGERGAGGGGGGSDDTWSLTPTEGWRLLNPASHPTGRGGHALGFHPGGGATPPRTVLFGGTTATGVSAQTWVYNGNNWSLVIPVSTPPGRSGHGIASDAGRGVVLMFGGSGVASNLNDTWEWDGTNWLLRGVGGPRPPSRSGHAMAWNENTGRVILFGGNPALDDTWEFDDATNAWLQRVTAPGNTPQGRVGAALAYDRFRREVVMFGGLDAANTPLQDTWTWDPALPPTGGWVRRFPTQNPPPARSGHAMAYDPVAQKVVMVGGVDALGVTIQGTWEWTGTTWRPRTQTPGRGYYQPLTYDSHREVAVVFGGGSFNTWEVTGSGWVRRTPSTEPSPRGVHGAAYDARRRRTVIFGGTDGGSGYFNETWEWDGTNWQNQLTQTSPSRRWGPAMAYDAARQVSVMFGGRAATGGDLAETWLYDGVDWRMVQPATNPPARSQHGMAYDERRQRVVLFGGVVGNGSGFVNDTWEWDGADWRQMTPAVAPSARATFLAYDEARGRVATFGGYSFPRLDDTWEWDGSNWQQQFPLQSPGPRGWAAFAYLAKEELLVIHGGVNGSGPPPDDGTWLRQSLFPARFRTRNAMGQLLGPGCAGSAGIPTLEVAVGERPWLGDTFTVHLRNVPANPFAAIAMGVAQQVPPIPLGGIGMGACQLHIVPAPLIFLPVTAQGTLTLTVPVDPSLRDGRFYEQAFTLDPPANMLGLSASDLAEGVFGVR